MLADLMKLRHQRIGTPAIVRCYHCSFPLHIFSSSFCCSENDDKILTIIFDNYFGFFLVSALAFSFSLCLLTLYDHFKTGSSVAFAFVGACNAGHAHCRKFVDLCCLHISRRIVAVLITYHSL